MPMLDSSLLSYHLLFSCFAVLHCIVTASNTHPWDSGWWMLWLINHYSDTFNKLYVGFMNYFIFPSHYWYKIINSHRPFWLFLPFLCQVYSVELSLSKVFYSSWNILLEHPEILKHFIYCFYTDFLLLVFVKSKSKIILTCQSGSVCALCNLQL